MSCLTTSATRRSRSVPAAVLIASAAASSHEVPLVPMISVTLYTLMTVSFDHVRPAPSCCGQLATQTWLWLGALLPDDEGGGVSLGPEHRDGHPAGAGAPGRELDPGREAQLGHQA